MFFIFIHFLEATASNVTSNTSKQLASNSPLLCASSTDLTRGKKKKKAKLRTSSSESAEPGTSADLDTSRNAKSKAIFKLSKSKSTIVGSDDDQTGTKKKKSSSRRRSSNQQISEQDIGKQEDSESDLEPSYNRRLRRPSNSSSKCSSKIEGSEIPYKKQKLINYPTTSKVTDTVEKKSNLTKKL